MSNPDSKRNAGHTLSRRTLGLGAAAGGVSAMAFATPVAAAEVTALAEEWEVVTEGFNDAAVQAAISRVLAGRSGKAMRRRLILPPGDYHLSQPLLRHDSAFPVGMLEGLRVEGMGKRSTKIFWENGGADPFITASKPRLRFFTVGGFTIASSNSGNEFAYCVSTAGGDFNQAWKLVDLEFDGSWKRVVGLDGGATANLNSEFTLDSVFTTVKARFADAFFRSGGISSDHGQQNQFLNYWIKDCCLTLVNGTVFRFDRGGSIRVQNGSWSAAKNDQGQFEPITWFHMPKSNSNNPTANQLTVRDVRFEPKSSLHKIIDCTWSGGSVLFDNCSDLGSVQNDTGMGYNFHRYVGTNLWGYGGIMPSVQYTQCQLAGYHLYVGDAVARGGIVYAGTNFFRGLGGNTANAVSGSAPVLRWTGGPPRYRFAECYNIANQSNF